MMKKIFLALALLLAWTPSFADSAYITEEGTSTGLLQVITGYDSDGNPQYGNLTMTEISSNLFYAVQEVSVEETTTIEFMAHHVVGLTDVKKAYPSDNLNGHAWIKLEGPGSYTLVFKYKYNPALGSTDELDVIQIACVAGSDADFFAPATAWDEGYTDNRMTFDSEDNCFHLYKDIESNGSQTISYKVLARCRTFEDAGKTWFPDGDSQTFSIPSAGKYTVDISFNPITRAAPTATLSRYEELVITSVGYATFSCPFATDVPATAIAHYVTGYSGTEVTTEKTTQVPATSRSSASETPVAGDGVLVEGEEGTYRFYETSESVSLPTNLLAGTGAYPYEAANDQTYVFASKSGVLGFYKGAGSTTEERTYAAYKAFLPLKDAGAREFIGVDFLSGSATSIENMMSIVSEGSPSDGGCYTLQGVRVAHPTQGVYIVGRRKVVLK